MASELVLCEGLKYPAGGLFFVKKGATERRIHGRLFRRTDRTLPDGTPVFKRVSEKMPEGSWFIEPISATQGRKPRRAHFVVDGSVRALCDQRPLNNAVRAELAEHGTFVQATDGTTRPDGVPITRTACWHCYTILCEREMN